MEFKCDQCTNGFKTQNSLNNHIRSIHGEKRFSCTLCDFVANRKDTLKAHKESIHENKKNWFCEACPFSSYTKQQFKIHISKRQILLKEVNNLRWKKLFQTISCICNLPPKNCRSMEVTGNRQCLRKVAIF